MKEYIINKNLLSEKLIALQLWLHANTMTKAEQMLLITQMHAGLIALIASELAEGKE